MKIICTCGKEITKTGVDIDITADDIEDHTVNKYFGLDLCHACAEEKLYPYLRKLGAEEI